MNIACVVRTGYKIGLVACAICLIVCAFFFPFAQTILLAIGLTAVVVGLIFLGIWAFTECER